MTPELTPLGFLTWIAVGFAFGFGWSVAHFVVGKIVSPRRAPNGSA